MTEYKKVFVDTAPFIYFIEKDINNPQYYNKVKNFFSNGYELLKRGQSRFCWFCPILHYIGILGDSPLTSFL